MWVMVQHKNVTFDLCPQLHGRSREQRYTKMADWEYINMCAKEADPMPLFGRFTISIPPYLLSFSSFYTFSSSSPPPSPPPFFFLLLIPCPSLLLTLRSSSVFIIIDVVICTTLNSGVSSLAGNGDILSFEDYYSHRRETAVAGSMIARLITDL